MVSTQEDNMIPNEPDKQAGKRNFFGFITILVLFCQVLVFACTTPKPAAIDSDLAHRNGYEQQQKDLRVYIRPLTDAKEIKKYFGADLIAKKILPVFVLTENKSETAVFLVEPADVYQPTADDKPATAVSVKEQSTYISAEDAKQSVYEKDATFAKSLLFTGPIFWLAAIPFGLADLGPSDASKSLQQALITKALRKQTLTPGKTESGFLYYHIPPDFNSAQMVGINIKATNVDTFDVISFRFSKERDQEGQNVKKQ
jgi:hypothetical protein